MIELGKRQALTCYKMVEFGAYLGSDINERVLLPKKEVPEEFEEGDSIDVFIYRDSEDRLIATTKDPLIKIGEIALLKVKNTTKIGAFLDWGLEKDLFMPFKEMNGTVEEGDNVAVYLYVDKSNRLAATMKIYPYLQKNDKFNKNDEVTGIIYDINKELGAFVAVECKYHGLIPAREIHKKIRTGEEVTLRVTEVRKDGKLNLSFGKMISDQMDEDCDKIVKIIENYGGKLPYTDKANVKIIERDFSMSKSAFKRAVGRLLKTGKIEIEEDGIRLK
ncbi:hypothetical protein SAMN02910289_01917 [Lachnospiraceae bacterium RM5]|nr:hypothetical protein SAMN02910289_01917 [Lachnospiraceae bacterium RM5]